MTPKQLEILKFLEETKRQSGVAPTFEEIQQRFSFSSASTVFDHLNALEKQGVIQRERGKSRGIKLLKQSGKVPVVGTITLAGVQAIDIEQEIEGSGDYALKVGDDSFQEELILEEDLLFVKTEIAELDGTYALCAIEGFGTLIKRVLKVGSQLHLYSQQYSIDPIKMHEEYVLIQGAIVHLQRNF